MFWLFLYIILFRHSKKTALKNTQLLVFELKSFKFETNETIKPLKKIIFLFPIAFFVTLLSISCADEEEDSPSRYLFIEQHNLINGELISGPEPPLIQIDFPTYSFDPDSGKLYGIINFNVDHNLEVIFGSGTCLTGTAGGGCGTGLTGIYSIPFVKGDFELLKFDETGRIVFEYKNQVYSLNAGEEWTSAKTYFDTIIHEEIVSISKITDSEKITNFGFIENEKVKKWDW